MKKILIITGIAASVVFSACTKDFDSINTNPTLASASQFNANLLLPTVQVGYFNSTAGYNGAILYQSMWAQIFADAEFPSYYSNGDKYVNGGSYNNYLASIWNNSYNAASKANEILELTKGVPEMVNLRGIALIMELMNLQLITDVYGDAPFSQALLAKSNGITSPVYDKQQDIYNSMLNKLDSILPTLDPAKPKPTNDATIYKGDVAKWKKFGYSLMLRMAMRLTKADLTTAKKYAEKAYAGGTFASIDDNAYIVLNDANGFTNGNASALGVAQDYTQVRWGKVLIDNLKASNDPRLPVIAEVPLPGVANAANKALAGISTPALQQGMPNGYDQNGGATDIKNAPGYPAGTGTGNDFNVIGGYSRPTTALYLSRSMPGILLTYAETELLLAEAAVRGWSVGTTASVHYKNGLAAALQSYSILNAAGTISATTANAYAAANPLDVSSTTNSLKQINTQFWITTGTLFNFIETWNNWRRSGYPALTPVNYIGSFSPNAVPRRFIYPLSEASNNGDAYKSVLGNYTNGDDYTSRMYWDK